MAVKIKTNIAKGYPIDQLFNLFHIFFFRRFMQEENNSVNISHSFIIEESLVDKYFYIFYCSEYHWVFRAGVEYVRKHIAFTVLQIIIEQLYYNI